MSDDVPAACRVEQELPEEVGGTPGEEEVNPLSPVWLCQVQQVMEPYPDVLINQPGEVKRVEHQIHTPPSQMVRPPLCALGVYDNGGMLDVRSRDNRKVTASLEVSPHHHPCFLNQTPWPIVHRFLNVE